MGPASRCAATNAYAEQWRRIWMLRYDIGQDSSEFRKVKAHQATSRLDYGTLETRTALGNGAADIEAKKGAACHPYCTP
eukprot:9149173-Pyramimonas_sp.AAC.1